MRRVAANDEPISVAISREGADHAAAEVITGRKRIDIELVASNAIPPVDTGERRSEPTTAGHGVAAGVCQTDLRVLERRMRRGDNKAFTRGATDAERAVCITNEGREPPQRLLSGGAAWHGGHQPVGDNLCVEAVVDVAQIAGKGLVIAIFREADVAAQIIQPPRGRA